MQNKNSHIGDACLSLCDSDVAVFVKALSSECLLEVSLEVSLCCLTFDLLFGVDPYISEIEYLEFCEYEENIDELAKALVVF